MSSKKLLVITNVSLLLVVALLALIFFEVQLIPLGKATATLKEEASCQVEWHGEVNEFLNLDQCCLEARKQLSCEQQERWVCQTGQGEVLKYQLNEAAYEYCQRQRIWR